MTDPVRKIIGVRVDRAVIDMFGLAPLEQHQPIACDPRSRIGSRISHATAIPKSRIEFSVGMHLNIIEIFKRLNQAHDLF